MRSIKLPPTIASVTVLLQLTIEGAFAPTYCTATRAVELSQSFAIGVWSIDLVTFCRIVEANQMVDVVNAAQ